MSELRAEETLREESQDDRGPASRLGVAALARDATIYGGTRVLVKSLAFLLVPLYAAFLSPTQFGILELVIATIAVVDVLIAANMDGVFMRFYFDRDDSAWRRQIISIYLVIETIYPAVVVGTLIALSGVISDWIFGTSAYSVFFVIALVDVYLTNVVDLPMMLCRVRRKPYTFAAYSLARGLVQIVASVLLVAVFEVGVKGILIASLASVCFAFLITLREYFRDLKRVTEWRIAREMASFAWPGIIGGLSFYALNLLDRFFVKHYHGLAESGLYGVAFRYSQVVLVAVLAFRLGWTSWHYSWLNSGRHEQMVARGANYYFFATGFLAVLVSAWILPVFHVAMPTRYWDATPAVAPLALAAVATGAYNIFAVGLNVKKRMRLLPPLAVGGALVAVGLYFLLIPPYSFQGAAWATAASFAILALATALVAHRIYPVPWDRYRILLAATAAAGLCLASLAVDDSVSVGVSIPIRVAITAAFPLLLLAFRFFPPGDLAAVRTRLRKLAPASR